MSGLISNGTAGFIPIAVLLASLAGSIHCTAMCGPLVTASTRGVSSVASYHLGRLLGYLGLGALAGALGDAIFSTKIHRYLELSAALAIGLTFVMLGIGVWRGKGLHFLPSRFLSRLIPALMNANRLGDEARGAGVGLLSALLPCGWLHSFVLAAVTTGSAFAGATLLAIFWIGTLPALTAGPLIFFRAIRPMTRLAPKISGTILIIAGIAFIGIRMAPMTGTEPSCLIHGLK